LVTGGTGTLGALLARHLVTQHGIKNLLLVSRRGPAAPGADELRHDLTQLGANTRIEACDTTDPTALRTLLDTIDPPLTAVIHTAGTLDDAALPAQNHHRLTTVFHPKATTAWNLHHLTQHLDLTAFILYSSAAGTLGNPGQANYAAANTYLDALATHRHTHAQPATSLAWGMWNEGMAATLDEAELARGRRRGMLGLTAAQGLALFDAALASTEPVLLPARLDLASLRARAAEGAAIPTVLRDLVRPSARRAAAAAATAQSLQQRLSGRDPQERAELLLNLVRENVASVLGLPGPGAVEPGKAFKDAGFDSLTAVELRNRLSEVAGVRLPATLVFDYPTPAALVELLQERLRPAEPESAEGLSVLDELDRLERAIAASGDRAVPTRQVAQRLKALSAYWESLAPSGPDSGTKLEDVTDDELFGLIEDELDRS
jgi:polyketide synthase 12